MIVVGVDGSDGSRDALRWAVGQARATGDTIRAIAAWEIPVNFGYPPGYEDFDWAATARQSLDDTVSEVVGGQRDVSVSKEVLRGHASNVLVDASRDADLLVVGSRGHGAVVGMLLGSVSQHCVQHAECPVLVVRPTRKHSAERDASA
ncbi:universal stress protein UspA-like protein [Saccharomonospora marina XMU15]|uniref:Universal stress protein UspA-like protein n=1 Tax=Saccharomonospora marina XMU15 TaxID=882083 RepID=H5X3U4_9PSEU|nr:universal stress protein [Saccharomonospora marina]EHR52162.1 universal stress protein UspA-like protein [Saccharomonospora marina XMU15]